MGQYHIPVNLDKKEFIDPHKLGAGLKLWEQLATHPGTAAALIVLLASASNGAGGGDLEDDPIIGRWRGDRIAFVGDYDDDTFYLVGDPDGGERMSGADIYSATKSGWGDVTEDVCRVLENEIGGKFSGDGWREFKRV